MQKLKLIDIVAMATTDTAYSDIVSNQNLQCLFVPGNSDTITEDNASID